MNPRPGSWCLLLLVVAAVGCKKGEGSNLPFQTVGRQPDVAPVMLNKELPFRYPPALYAQKVPKGKSTLESEAAASKFYSIHEKPEAD